MNSEAIVIEIRPTNRNASRHQQVLPHRLIGGQQLDVPEFMPEKPDRNQLLRELLDESHKQIRLLEAQIKRLRSALIRAKLGEEE